VNQTSQGAQQRCLAGTVRPPEQNDSTTLDVEINSSQRGKSAEERDCTAQVDNASLCCIVSGQCPRRRVGRWAGGWVRVDGVHGVSEGYPSPPSDNQAPGP
jgi:hypothetical protein